ncbi:serine/threonine-protein kinase [Ktedonospora formicarum]|uniref:Protein kinase domain-containing protein n=1 Tax=Ktedonospora formicarum TaxID=2778364 RepID=A0A8J3I6Y2_9CHLR|nr:serine/threonine-protein kinase [Ktedonospora formicarum]GHO48233.1 hypothetical protein KSX_63960 [Ktedonospora formicarum]
MKEEITQQLGNYRLVRLLGKGAFAEVYLAEHINRGARVALKALRMYLPDERTHLVRQQAQALARLSHPNILSLIDAGLQFRQPYLVMEYAPGGTLRQRHFQGERLGIPTIHNYVRQITQGLYYAHEHGLAHGNLKPENILLDAHGKLVVSDFSIPALTYGAQTGAIGSLAYMSPEQIRGEVHASSDQYALGILIYEWLCGELPFQGTATEIAKQQISSPPPPIREKLPNLHPMLARVIHMALAKEDALRFESIQAFSEAFEQAIITHNANFTGMLAAVRPQSSATQLEQMVEKQDPKESRKRSRRALIAGLVGLGVFGVAGTGITSLIFTQQRSQGRVRLTYRGHNAGVLSFAWSSDGARIISGGEDHTAQVWNVADGRTIYTYRDQPEYLIKCTIWSPDNKRVACASNDQTVRVWNAVDGDNLYTFSGHSGPVNSVSWSPNGARIASASDDHSVQVWSPAQVGSVYSYLKHTQPVTDIAWSSDSKLIASCSADQTVRVWNSNNGNEVSSYNKHKAKLYTVAWSPDGQRIASAGADHTVRVWNVADGKDVAIYTGHTGAIYDIAWSPDGQRIVSGSADHTAQIWNAANGTLDYIYQGHYGTVNSVAWSHDGMWIATAGDDHTVQIWDAGGIFHFG